MVATCRYPGEYERGSPGIERGMRCSKWQRNLHTEPGYAVYEAGSGDYSFTSPESPELQ
jgi:hypothetical protein